MKFINLILFIFFMDIKSLAQDSLWTQNSIGDFLTFSLPSDFQHKQSGYIKAFAGQLNSNFYGVQYYDSVSLSIDDEHLFQISLLGFINGRASDPMLKGYSALVIDTSIGGTVGLLSKFTTTDSAKFYKQIYYYATLANNRYCWFYVYTPSTNEDNREVAYFFKSIKFEADRLKEKKFKLTPVYLKKSKL